MVFNPEIVLLKFWCVAYQTTI